MTDPTAPIAMVERYVLAIAEGRIDDVAACFAAHAHLRDPYDGPTVEGRDAIHAFFRANSQVVDHLALNGPICVTADGASAAAPMVAHVTLEGVDLEIHTVDVFFFGDDGLFSAMHAFYGPTNSHPRT